MPPKHIAQTSTEAKKAYKKNGPVISERTHKQLQRGFELEQRAAREREAEKRRKSAKERREEKERKEKAIRHQLGVGLATQLIGYSHTQANLKKGMEAFLGVNKKRQEEERRKEAEKRREEELANLLEVIAQDIEKEPFDDDDDMDDVMLDLPDVPAQDAGYWVDDELDDDTLFEAHKLVMSDPTEEPTNASIAIPPLTTAPPVSRKQNPRESQHSPYNDVAPVQYPEPSKSNNTKDDIEFTRIHGPKNKAVESALGDLPGETIELLSEDAPSCSSSWSPAHGLLYKLSPMGIPPHRLRIKVGCVVVCLRDLNTSSQLSKSQHVRILRVENERLECLTLDGQLAGTKTVITRVPFPAKYRNDDKYPFIRTQYPVRVATDYSSITTLRETTRSGFRLPAINGQMRPPTLVRRPTPLSSKSKPQINSNPSFKLPGLSASRAQVKICLPRCQPTAPPALALGGWDDFLDSGTQIARELSADPAPKTTTMKTMAPPPPVTDSVSLLSTQDLDFSLDDLDDEPQLPNPRSELQRNPRPPSYPLHRTDMMASVECVIKPLHPAVTAAVQKKTSRPPLSVPPGPLRRTANIRRIDLESDGIQSTLRRPHTAAQSRLKRPMEQLVKPAPTAKKPRVAPTAPASHSLPTVKTATLIPTSRRFSDFGLSTQEANSFFDDDDDFAFGSPPIAV